MRTRVELLAHVQHPNSPYNLPELGKQIASKAHREGGAERFTAPAVQKSIAVDLALITQDDQLRTDLELSIVKAAKHHDANTLYLLQTVPGIGKILGLVLRYDIHDIDRCSRVQEFVSYCRLVKCAKASAGKRLGTSAQHIGNASRTWACSAAAALCLHNNPAGQKRLARLQHQHGQGKALTILAHRLARAVYDMPDHKIALI
jgi:transposase